MCCADDPSSLDRMKKTSASMYALGHGLIEPR
ncbi:hypothetical protein D806_045510 [Mycolicibacterium smegmatis MKD8]|uniref:Uncharacterized protein n=1 Tax=Mycolicibacterium smegmatis (strain MKD8) TaxID=1214915 RepID=A0A2U9PUT5_MYCSE|nr:hypothetical protein D806_045510 [Mycolicibacterium smegmatis MKD8]